MTRHPSNLAGIRFGRLTCVEVAGRYDLNRETIWLCHCNCGAETKVRRSALISGKTRSCGCLARDTARQVVLKRNTSHGAAKTRLYRIWRHVKERCLNPNCKSFHDYGGRGIGLCDEWRAFEPFQAWALANGYRKNLTIERVDVDGDYSPHNCTWIPKAAQNRNRRDTRYLTLDGVTRPLPEWSEIYGVSPSTIRTRLARGWSTRETLECPVRKWPSQVAEERGSYAGLN